MFQLCVLLLALIITAFMFEQNDYIIEYERLEVFQEYKEYIQDLKTVNFKHNRTTAASNYSGYLKKDLGNNVAIQVQGFKWASNEYRLFPIVFEFDFCKAVARNDYGLQNLYKCGNFPKCPFKKGHYRFCNFIPDQSKFPPYIPEGRYRIDLKFMYFTHPIQYLQFYGTVKRPMKYPFE